jgi:AraC-like DNA-binding protein
MREHVVRSAFETTDVDEGVAVVREAYPGSEWRAPQDRPFSSALSFVGDRDLTFFDMDQRATVDATFPRQPSFIIGSPTEPTLSVSAGRDDLDVTRPFLYPQRELHAAWHEELSLRVVQIREDAVRQVAAARYDIAPDSLKMLGTAPISRALERYWNHVVAHARAVADDIELFDVNPVRGDLAQHIIGAMLIVFPHNMSDHVAPSDRTHTAAKAVKRAIAYMEANRSESFSLADVAAAARLSQRGLQSAFRRDLGTTPFGYLQKLRLDGARQDLLAADPTAGATVSATARRWGFSHLGRFASVYRETYGEAPSRTLHR